MREDIGRLPQMGERLVVPIETQEEVAEEAE